jgi:hypothetical protein
MRVKLAVAIVLRQSECLCSGAHELSFHFYGARGPCARSLSAIR